MLRQKITAADLRGVITALITPFGKSKVELDKFDELIELAIEAELCGILPLGTTGEAPAMNADERHAVIQRAVNKAGDKIRVIIGAGTNNTRTTIENSRQAAEIGADAVLIVTPYYNKPSPAGLKKHFLAVANASPVPVILYHIPGRCGVGIPLNLVLELAAHENIIGIKEAGGDVFRSGEIARQTAEGFTVLSGDDALTLPLLAVGAQGVISVTSNLAPRLMKRLVEAALNGDYAQALCLHQQLSPLFRDLFLESNPAPVKEAMNQLGLAVGEVRPPLASVLTATRKAISKTLELVGDLE